MFSLSGLCLCYPCSTPCGPKILRGYRPQTRVWKCGLGLFLSAASFKSNENPEKQIACVRVLDLSLRVPRNVQSNEPATSPYNSKRYNKSPESLTLYSPKPLKIVLMPLEMKTSLVTTFSFILKKKEHHTLKERYRYTLNPWTIRTCRYR